MQLLTVDSALALLPTCNGLIMTGGEDVDPARYGKTEDSAMCKTNPKRDTLEFALIKKATELRMPLFGICRGQQIINVAFGGTLIADMPTQLKSEIQHQCDDYLKCYHLVNAEPGSRLAKITESANGQVTSNHHQAVDKLADGFIVSSRSEDGIIESIEYQDTAKMPFLITVQWHPERMDTVSHFSMPIIRAFIDACKK